MSHGPNNRFMGDSTDRTPGLVGSSATGVGSVVLLSLIVTGMAACAPPALDSDPAELPDWTIEATTLSPEATAPPLPVIVELRAGSHAGYDRLTLELEGGSDQPGIRTRYLDQPVIECGSGRPVDTIDGSRIELRLEPAAAHTEAGAPTLEGRETAVDGELLRHIYRTCDFEGIVTFVLALEDRRPYRVFRLDDPPRVVVDVRH